jgi:hypothetical protein
VYTCSCVCCWLFNFGCVRKRVPALRERDKKPKKKGKKNDLSLTCTWKKVGRKQQ